jgi:hypothetical protein
MTEVEYIQSTVDLCDERPLNVWAADFDFEPGSPPCSAVLGMGFRGTDRPSSERPTVPVPDGAVKSEAIAAHEKIRQLIGENRQPMRKPDDSLSGPRGRVLLHLCPGLRRWSTLSQADVWRTRWTRWCVRPIPARDPARRGGAPGRSVQCGSVPPWCGP